MDKNADWYLFVITNDGLNFFIGHGKKKCRLRCQWIWIQSLTCKINIVCSLCMRNVKITLAEDPEHAEVRWNSEDTSSQGGTHGIVTMHFLLYPLFTTSLHSLLSVSMFYDYYFSLIYLFTCLCFHIHLKECRSWKELLLIAIMCVWCH